MVKMSNKTIVCMPCEAKTKFQKQHLKRHWSIIFPKNSFIVSKLEQTNTSLQPLNE